MKYQGIVLSGKPCAGKSTLCEMLSKEFKLKVYSLGQIWRDRWRAEHPNGEISFEEYWRKTSDEENRKVNDDAREIMKCENLIVDSRYTAFYCKDLPYLRVFLDADLDIRVGRISKRDSLDINKAVKLKETLLGREVDELKMGMKLFNEDYRKIRHYHLFLNTSYLTPEQEFNCLKALLE